jgi:hypothetical protein
MVKVAWWIEVTFFWSTCFTKISVLMFYRRLVRNTYSNRFKIAIWCGIGFLVLYTIVYQALAMLTCRPLDAFWMQYSGTYHKKFSCWPNETQVKIVISAGCLSVLTDLYSVVLPASLLMKIRISKRQKSGLIFVFGIGFL